MNTLHHTNPRAQKRAPAYAAPGQGKRAASSGALQRRDQDVKGHHRMGGKASSSHYSAVGMRQGDHTSAGPKTLSGHAEFGTIGARISRPER